MLKIIFEAQTVDDDKTPITVANAVIRTAMDVRGISHIEDEAEVSRRNLIWLEEVANHILLYIDSHRRLMNNET